MDPDLLVQNVFKAVIALGGTGILGYVVVRILNGPIASAIGDRLRGKHLKPAETDIALHEEVRAELAAMNERLDFVERALVAGRQGGHAFPPDKK